MRTTNKIICVLLAVLTLTSAILFSAESTEDPVRLEIALDKSKYFVTNSAQVSVTVHNIGDKTLQNLTVNIYSDKHQLLFGSQSVFEIDVLESTKSVTFYSEMALNRKTAGLGLFGRILLFFTQLHRNYTPFAHLSGGSRKHVSESVRFQHGSVLADLRATVWYEIKPETTKEETSYGESTLYDPVENIGDDYIIDNPIPTPTPTPTPQVTYLDKYVRDILKTGTYTLRMDVQAEDGVTVPVTIYSDANNSEIKMSVASVAMQGAGYESVASFMKNVGTLRYIVTNKNSQAPKRYIATDAAYVELEKGGELSEVFGGEMVFGEENVSLDMLVTLLQQNMKYVSSMTTSGIMVEVYETEGVKSENGVETGPQQIKFYFTKVDGYVGLVRIRIIDKDTNESQVLVVRLYNDVQKDGLTTPFKPSGVKKTEKELLEMFEKLG